MDFVTIGIQYNYCIRNENLVTFLSRIQKEGDVIPIDDIFPYDNRSFIYIYSPWFAYIVNELAVRMISQHFSSFM